MGARPTVKNDSTLTFTPHRGQFDEPGQSQFSNAFARTVSSFATSWQMEHGKLEQDGAAGDRRIPL
jgi:hypothetical protein